MTVKREMWQGHRWRVGWVLCGWTKKPPFFEAAVGGWSYSRPHLRPRVYRLWFAIRWPGQRRLNVTLW